MDFRQFVFQYRSYTPIPFVVVMVVFAQPVLWSMLAGIFLVALGEGIRLWGVAIAGSETRTTGPVGGTYLITRGPFAYVRNPLYVGNMLIYGGVGVMANVWFPYLAIGAVLFFFVQYSLIVHLEEGYLAKAFGDEYDRYRASVRRFIPRLTRFVPGENIQPPMDWKDGLRSERRTLQAIGLVILVLSAHWFLKG